MIVVLLLNKLCAKIQIIQHIQWWKEEVYNLGRSSKDGKKGDHEVNPSKTMCGGKQKGNTAVCHIIGNTNGYKQFLE